MGDGPIQDCQRKHESASSTADVVADSFADRRRGALIGLAVGDALGAAVECRRPGLLDSAPQPFAGNALIQLTLSRCRRTIETEPKRARFQCTFTPSPAFQELEQAHPRRCA